MACFQTKRLNIRMFTPNDLEMLYEINNHPECIRYNGWSSMSKNECMAVLNKWINASVENPAHGVFCVELNREGNAEEGKVGMTFLMDHRRSGKYEMGFRFKRDLWGYGYAQELVDAWTDYAKNRHHAKAVYAEVDGENMRSLNVFRKRAFCEKEHPSGQGGILFYKNFT